VLIVAAGLVLPASPAFCQIVDSGPPWFWNSTIADALTERLVVDQTFLGYRFFCWKQPTNPEMAFVGYRVPENLTMGRMKASDFTRLTGAQCGWLVRRLAVRAGG
jgi:hypothetical protein